MTLNIKFHFFSFSLYINQFCLPPNPLILKPPSIFPLFLYLLNTQCAICYTLSFNWCSVVLRCSLRLGYLFATLLRHSEHARCHLPRALSIGADHADDLPPHLQRGKEQKNTARIEQIEETASECAWKVRGSEKALALRTKWLSGSLSIEYWGKALGEIY